MPLSEFDQYQVEMVEPVIDYRARDWCKLPYPDHPHGCPNYGRRASCPPRAPRVDDYFDLSQPVWLVAVEFDLQGHVDRMKRLHPGWSDRQARCVLYWQAGVNKELETLVRYLGENAGLCYTLCPEAMGVQVIKTANQVQIPVRPRPTSSVYKIALMGKFRGKGKS